MLMMKQVIMIMNQQSKYHREPTPILPHGDNITIDERHKIKIINRNGDILSSDHLKMHIH